MPPSLRENAESWRRELLDALSSPEQDRKRVNRCKNRYKKDDILEALEEMYGELCCYCEARIGTVAFGEIEHRRPKSSQPEYTFEWDNLHLACPRCNRAKGKKWNDEHPILDSFHDTISEHLSYSFGEGGVKRWSETHRGITTINHAKLNRKGILNARTLLAHRSLQRISEINSAPDSPAARQIREELEDKTSGEYGSLINWLLTSYLRDPSTPDP